MRDCDLFSHSVKLPEWGFEQQEVTCITSGKFEKAIWYIENSENKLCKWKDYAVISSIQD